MPIKDFCPKGGSRKVEKLSPGKPDHDIFNPGTTYDCMGRCGEPCEASPRALLSVLHIRDGPRRMLPPGPSSVAWRDASAGPTMQKDGHWRI